MKQKTIPAATLRTERNDRWRPGPTSVQHGVLTTAEPTIEKDVMDVWLEQPLDPHWMAAFRLVRGGSMSRLRVGELRLFPIEAGRRNPAGEWSGAWRGIDADAPRRGLTKQIIHRARPHLWLREAERNLPRFREVFGMPPADAPKGSARGRPRMPDADLARVAERYVRACKTSRRPVEVVAEQCHESVIRVRGWISKARDRRLLSRRAQGQTGGQLTARATAILAQQQRTTKKKKERKR